MNTSDLVLLITGVAAGFVSTIFGNFIYDRFFSRRTFNPSNAVELLKKSKPEEWNEVRMLNKDWTPDLSNANLNDLALPLVDFRRANLSHASFRNALLDGANFDEATLVGADFHKASLADVNFDAADLSTVNFEGADLKGASFRNANLTKAILPSDVISKNDSDDESTVIKSVFDNPNKIDNLKPLEFENLVLQILNLSGYEVIKSNQAKDQGYDFLAKKEDPIKGAQTYVVEVKKTPKDYKVGLSSLRALYGSLLNAKADEAMLVTTTDVTASAKTFAQEAPIQIIGRQQLINWISRLPSRNI